MKKLFLLPLFGLFSFAMPAMEKETENVGNKRKREEINTNSEKSQKVEDNNIDQSFFDVLPKEIKLLIFSNLAKAATLEEAIKNIKAVACVNKNCQQLISDPLLTNELIHQLAKNFNQNPEKKSIIPRVHKLTLEPETVAIKLGTPGAIDWLKKLPKIKTYNSAEEAIRYVKEILESPLIWWANSVPDVRTVMALMMIYPEVALTVINYKRNGEGLWNEEPLLARAIKAHNKELVSLLLKKGANPNIRDRYNSVINPPNIDILKLLLSYGFDINMQNSATNMCKTLLAANAYDGYFDMVEQLLRNDADPNIQNDNNGYTALMHAIISPHFEGRKNDFIRTIQLLLKYGSNIFKVNFNNDTALSLAKKNGRLEVVRIIEDHINSSEIDNWFSHLK